ncbi:MAG: fibronectin type III domain-containing protein [Acidobacteria bacterium]|nr:fibronectin type III domain-containing protein [Acidobacteriota bacterium]
MTTHCLCSRARASATASLLVACALSFAPAASAQERIELLTVVNNQTRIVEVDASVTGFGSVRSVTPVPNGVEPAGGLLSPYGEMVTVAGGRYLAWTTYGALLAFDRRTRTLFDATGILPRTFGVLRLGEPRVVESDSHRPRLFVAGFAPSGAELWAIDLEGQPPVQLGATQLGRLETAYAADPDELFYLNGAIENGVRVTWVVAVNASTGQELRRWKRSGVVSAIRTDASGRIVWIDHGGLEAIDATTGVTLALSDQFSAANTIVDAPRQLLLVRQGDFLVAVDPLLLTEIGRTRVAFMPPDDGMSRASQSLAGRWMTGAYTVRTETRQTLVSIGRTGSNDVFEFTCNAITVDALYPNGARRDSADVLATLGPGGGVIGSRYSPLTCRAHAVLVRSPFAPSALTSIVTGNTVQLTWKNPGDTSEFELEFGFAPGQRAGSVRLGRAPGIAIPGVPPGVYYVRVKAHNEVGASPPSADVRVVVP